MIYYFDTLGNAIQKWVAVGDKIDLLPLIARHYQDMQSIGCANHAFSDIDVALDELCWHRGMMKVRTNNPAALDVNNATHVATLTRLSVGGYLTINGTRYVITDATITVDITYSGSYDIVVDAMPYRRTHFLIEIP